MCFRLLGGWVDGWLNDRLTTWVFVLSIGRPQIAHNEAGEDVPARLWTSTLRRTRETAQFIAQQRILVK